MTYQYHDALDRYEARMRAEQEERELDEAQEVRDLVEFLKPEGSDTSMNAQLNDAGFGPGGVM